MVRVLSTSSEKINIDLLDSKKSSKLTLVHTPMYGENHWLLLNRTPTTASRPDVAVGKQKFKDKSPEDLGRYLSDRYALTSKIDGASVTVNFGDRTEIFSTRPSVTGELYEHTHILKADEIKIPEELKGTKLRAEIFAVKGNKVVPMRTLGGLMNSSPEKALQQMEDQSIRMYIAPYQVLAHGGASMEGHPYKDQLKVLESVIKKMPGNWVMPDVALTPKKKQEMADLIRKGKHPLTSEGMVAWPMEEVAATPVKLKFREHSQVYIDEVFPLVSGGEEQPRAGGFTYRLTPRGAPVGKVGTGFTNQLRKELWDNRGELKGRKVLIESAGQFPSGAYRAPSFISFHL
jgi:ATP-dependent DNA ligase